MHLVHYQPNTLPDLASHEEALIATTSSQILLSRDIADTDSPTISSPEIPESPWVTSIFETNTKHIMTLGEAGLTANQSLNSGNNQVGNGNTTRQDHAEFATLHRTMTLTTDRDSFMTAPESQSVSSINSPIESFDCGPNYSTDGPGGEDRGRTFHRTTRRPNPFERAESRARHANAIIELASASVDRVEHSCGMGRYIFDQPATRLYDPFSKLLPSSTTDNAGTTSPQYHHKTSGLILGQGIKQAAASPTSSSSVSSTIPAEVLRQIYLMLSPDDFNSARHTCRAWFIHSLEKSLLVTMCKRAGIGASLPKHALDLLSSSLIGTPVNEEWLLSKKLAREAALGPDWPGSSSGSMECMRRHAFIKIADVNFSEIAVQPRDKGSVSAIFTTSICSRFLLVANGCLVYVYELNRRSGLNLDTEPSPGSLRPVTSVICPARVLACSMDTSSERYAIAILLDNRMGMVCDIASLKRDKLTKDRTASRHLKRDNDWTGPSLEQVLLSDSDGSGSSRHQPFVFPGIAASGTRSNVYWHDSDPSSTQTSCGSRHGSISRLSVLSQSRLDKAPVIQRSSQYEDSSVMPVESGPRSLYRNICSEEDPPRSVAICPQRRCVAFGCSSGIELHWIDALTGQDLNRWFPLTSPSDYLFFLPPRQNVDSAKKLRLISSAARPCERSAIAKRVHGESPLRSPLWQRMGWDFDFRNGLNATRTQRQIYDDRVDSSDHFCAVPLSDGYHVLFTDPTTGLLCLGSDAPMGGPTKLLRKIWFEGPKGSGSPIIYVGGSNLQYGARVVAAYKVDDKQLICLFSVPIDIFTADNPYSTASDRRARLEDTAIDGKNMDWRPWWITDEGRNETASSGTFVRRDNQRSSRPLKIRGQIVGSSHDLMELGIDSGPSMAIWAFGKNGISKVWKLDCGESKESKTTHVMQDGTLREMDGDGDIAMIDALHVPGAFDASAPGDLESFDGASYTEDSANEVSDMILAQRGSLWSPNQGRYAFEHLIWSIRESGTINQHAYLTRHELEWVPTDYITRLDVEIF